MQQSGSIRPSILVQDDHVRWHVCGDRHQGAPVAYVRGHAAIDDSFLENAKLAEYIQQLAVRGPQSLQAAIPELNGGWALVVEWPGGEVLAAVDRLRTVPLFYYQDADGFAIAASASELAQRFSRPLSVRGQLEFLLFLYVTGSETLYEGVRQLQSGEMIFYQPEGRVASTSRYFRFYPTAVSTDGADALSEELAATLQQMFERFRDGLGGKRVVIPLSGGLDSRLVAAMLQRVGVEDVLCFSFGETTDEEVQLSRQAAEALKLPWRFIRYTPELCGRWNRSEKFRAFLRYGCKGASLTHPHDYPAVMQLAEEGLAGPDVVYFPGHSADMNAGSHIPADYADILSGKISRVAHILRGHGRGVWDDPAPLLNAPAAEGLMEKFAGLTAVPSGATFEDHMACCEMWNAEQRQSKYIINSVRTYEFVGAKWRTLWDYEFMDFFLRVPVELRYGQKLYLDCIRDKVFVGEFAELAKIPLAKHGPLAELASVRGPAHTSAIASAIQAIKRQVRLQLLKAGVSRRALKPVPHSLLMRVRLAGLGIPDGAVSVRETLDRLGALEWLAPEIQEALGPWMGYSLDSLRFRTVYTMLVAAEMAKDAHSDPGQSCEL